MLDITSLGNQIETDKSNIAEKIMFFSEEKKQHHTNTPTQILIIT